MESNLGFGVGEPVFELFDGHQVTLQGEVSNRQ